MADRVYRETRDYETGFDVHCVVLSNLGWVTGEVAYIFMPSVYLRPEKNC